MRSPVNRKIQQAFDNIPKQYTTDAILLTDYIAKSVRVTSYDIVENHYSGVQVRDGRLNIFIHPPSRDSRNYLEWIDIFRRQIQYIAIEDDELRPIEQIFCDHCTGCTHPTHLCPFFTLPEFIVVHFPERTHYTVWFHHITLPLTGKFAMRQAPVNSLLLLCELVMYYTFT